MRLPLGYVEGRLPTLVTAPALAKNGTTIDRQFDADLHNFPASRRLKVKRLSAELT